MTFKVKTLFFVCLFVCFAVTSYLFLVSEDLLSKKMSLNNDKKEKKNLPKTVTDMDQ